MFLGIAFITIAAFTVGGLAFAAGSNYGSLTSSDHIINDNVHATFEYDHELRYRPSFFSMLALYYPSMTGIMTGSNRPGDVSKPGKNIPFGTLTGMAITSSISLLIIYLFGFSVMKETLLDDRLILAT
eukprot:gene5498-7016_t